MKNVLSNENWNLVLNKDGSIAELEFKNKTSLNKIDFRQDDFRGPRWYLEGEGIKVLTKTSTEGLCFSGTEGELRFSIEYKSINGNLAVVCTLKNIGNLPIQPIKCGIKFGVDTYMDRFPEWNNKFFPTLLRCEKTHFWGYCMSPNGKIFGIASPDAIASWSFDYNVGYLEDSLEWYGHRIETFNLDFLNALPLPQRHPHSLYEIQPGEEKVWTVYLVNIDAVENIMKKLQAFCEAPMFEIDKTTIGYGETSHLKIFSNEDIYLKITSHEGKVKYLTGVNEYILNSKCKAGVYTFEAITSNGKITEAKVSIRKSWSWIMERARDAAFKYPPRATSHCESLYGLFTLYLSEKYFHNKEMLEKTESVFNNIYPKLYDIEEPSPIVIKHRIQNTTTMMSILVDRYEATGDIESLERASALADWIINNCQHEDGSYRANLTHYTCVIYPAKSFMELALAEKQLAKSDSKWQKNYERHFNSLKLAIDELYRADGNIDTEGEITFEDGMISCCAAQLFMFALFFAEEEKEKNKYKESALKILESHNSLTSLIIPDSRRRGGTMRFWEAQYDIGMAPNMLNSPHGWTSWRTYATWYAYLLIGEEKYLIETMNALGSCTQAIDINTGELRWAFVADPYVRARQISEACPDNPSGYNDKHQHTLKFFSKEFIIGEQYINMVSDWQKVNFQDNDVHEHFKCLEEVALSACYIIERINGEFLTWNCSIKKENNILKVTPAENIINKLHVNLKKIYIIKTNLNNKEICNIYTNMTWIKGE